MLARGLMLALAVLVGTPAFAGDKRAAAAHFRDGRSLYDAGRYEDALAAFEAGFEAYPLRGFLVNIGQCQRKLDRLEDAAASYQKFLDGAGGDDKVRSEVVETLAELKVEIERRTAAQQVAAVAAAPEPTPAVAPTPAPTQALNFKPASSTENEVRAQQPRKKSRAWLWTLVGVVAAGAVAGAVAAAVIETQPTSHAGSLGLIDGRR
jgi:tetratricopeptide (TPR) repeat protein